MITLKKEATQLFRQSLRCDDKGELYGYKCQLESYYKKILELYSEAFEQDPMNLERIESIKNVMNMVHSYIEITETRMGE